MTEFKPLSEAIWELPKEGSMRVPGKVIATEKLLKEIESGSIQQLKNVATLPGIQQASIAMPDMHWGYGFPIGGVAAMDYENGVVSPGGIGFDINCGVRLIKTNLTEKELRPKLKELLDELYVNIPVGLRMGKRAKIALSKSQMNAVLQEGARWAVGQGYGWKADLEHTEEQGCMPGADPQHVSAQAIQRGMPQCGTLGSGNHFLEIQRVEQVLDASVAKSFGLEKGQIALMLHSGSRGLGHQIASDFIEVMQGAMPKHGIEVPDRQLACVPIQSKEGQAYLSAMKCGVNFAFCNRELMTHWARESFAKVFGQSAESLEMELLYDVCHNVAKEEEHMVDGKRLKLLVHRKGATRAMPAGRKENLKVFEKTGHPAIVPGSMGTASYVIVGTQKALAESFGTVCHGAGRSMSRSAAMKSKRGEQVKKELEALGEVVKAASIQGLAEEMPEAYKDVDEVVESVVRAGIGKKVARMVPVGVLKG